MSNIFFCSDHHLVHSNILTFTRSDNGEPLRPGFNFIEEHDEHIIQQHNKVVRSQDRVYFLGDVTFHKRNLYLLNRMQGRKILIKGNHDILELKEYLPYFDDIRAIHQFDGMCMTHVPIHPDSLSRWKVNIHGHLHSNRVMIRGFAGKPVEPDERYQNVSMEQLDDYTPISLEQMRSKIRNLGLIS